MDDKRWLIVGILLAASGCVTSGAVAAEDAHYRRYRRDDGVLMACSYESQIGSHLAEPLCDPVSGSEFQVPAQYVLDKVFLEKATPQSN